MRTPARAALGLGYKTSYSGVSGGAVLVQRTLSRSQDYNFLLWYFYYIHVHYTSMCYAALAAFRTRLPDNGPNDRLTLCILVNISNDFYMIQLRNIPLICVESGCMKLNFSCCNQCNAYACTWSGKSFVILNLWT